MSHLTVSKASSVPFIFFIFFLDRVLHSGESAILHRDVDGGTRLRAKILRPLSCILCTFCTFEEHNECVIYCFQAKIAQSNDTLDSSEIQCLEDIEKDVVREESAVIVTITEEDVDGAKLPHKPFLNINEMRKYLSLRGQDSTGRKSDLWER